MARKTIRSLLKEEKPLVLPGAHDALSALLIKQAGFKGFFIGGFQTAGARHGLPDIGLCQLGEFGAAFRDMVNACDLPVLVDADNGYGDVKNCVHLLHTYERMGISAMFIEDQVAPKRCGHMAGKTVIPAGEMVGKIKAALDARQGDMALICRTDAIAVEGFAAALDRADAYAEAGADMIFVEAPPGQAELAAVARRYAGKVPVMANMVEGGRTPMQPASALEALGYKLVIFPGGTVRALAFALQDYFQSLKSNGTTTPWRNRMLDFQGINKLIDTDGFLVRGKSFEG